MKPDRWVTAAEERHIVVSIARHADSLPVPWAEYRYVGASGQGCEIVCGTRKMRQHHPYTVQHQVVRTGAAGRVPTI